ncbi:hypothetical protein COCVIDRAFT_16137 [Bipolaris victoriae FI3]|uniref:Uncharacterized protein n=1 Tax=Bipolaris victoriae (strain FI3) TaxID=930091 RepID=W7ES94_BIPV3|nr:hypothetical protein COCVIDRAFT_16137 [Bipolaris victoriae FI3]
MSTCAKARTGILIKEGKKSANKGQAYFGKFPPPSGIVIVVAVAAADATLSPPHATAVAAAVRHKKKNVRKRMGAQGLGSEHRIALRPRRRFFLMRKQTVGRSV